MDITAQDLNSFGVGLVEVLIFIGFLGGLWQLLNVATTSFDDHREIVEGQNWAYLIQRLGITTAQAIGMLAAVGLGAEQRWADVAWLAAAGVWVALLLLAVHPLIDRMVARRARPTADARGDGIAVSMVKAAFYIGFGCVVNGSLSGSAPDWGTAAAATAVFTALGGALLVAGYFLIDLVNPFPVRDGVADGRLASGFEAAGVLVALGLIVRNAIAGDFVGWGSGIAGFALVAGVGLVILYLTRWVFDRLVLSGSSLREVHEANRVSAAALLAAFLPLAALPVTAVVGTLV